MKLWAVELCPNRLDLSLDLAYRMRGQAAAIVISRLDGQLSASWTDSDAVMADSPKVV